MITTVDKLSKVVESKQNQKRVLRGRFVTYNYI